MALVTGFLDQPSVLTAARVKASRSWEHKRGACRWRPAGSAVTHRGRADRPKLGANPYGLAQIGTFPAEGLAARASSDVLPLDVVASVAVSVVVVDNR